MGECVIRMLHGSVMDEEQKDSDDATFTAFELCPFLLIKRLTVSDSGNISQSEYLGSYKSESRQAGLVIHSFIDADSGKKTIVEYLCEFNRSTADVVVTF